MPPAKGFGSGAGRPAASAAKAVASTSKKRKLDPNAEKFYAVRAGKRPGVYRTWAECQQQTAGFPGATYKSFLSRKDAEDFVAGKNPHIASDGTREVKFYAVAVGRDPGIYTEWEKAAVAIKGWKGPKYKRFDTRAEAIDFIRAFGNDAAQKSIQAEMGGPPSKRAKVNPIANEEDPLGFLLDDDDEEEEILHVYTDGSSLSNGRAGASAGVGVFFGKGDPRNVSERLGGSLQTNQRAELTAILRALEKAGLHQDIRIYTDSKYSINCVTSWYRNWEKNGWKTKEGPVKNKDLVSAIREKIEERDEVDTKTLFEWVKGHSDIAGNVEADKLAVNGASLKMQK